MYTVRPICTGHLLGVDKSTLVRLHHMGERIDIPSVTWVILGGPHPVVVDPGSSSSDRALALHDRRLEVRTPPDAGLRALGVEPQDVTVVVNTHLHWDHASNNHLFPNAEILVQRSEWAYALDPLPCDRDLYETGTDGAAWSVPSKRYTLIDGDQEILPGIRLLHLPGHSPGSQGVLVETADGPILLSGDHFDLYENLHEERPVGIYVSLEDWYASLRRVQAIHPLTVIPGHDPAVVHEYAAL